MVPVAEQLPVFKSNSTINNMDKRFAVTSNSFSLYEAFKRECEKIGWIYRASFTGFDEDEIKWNNCLFFSTRWSNCFPFQFSLSNHSDDYPIFKLESQWDDALLYAKKLFSKSKKIRISISKVAAKYGVDVKDVIIVA